jgi:MraZ protein
VFKGTYRHRIDAKGRLPVPAGFRRWLDAGSVVVTLLDQCLAAYPPAEWGRLEQQLAALPAFGRQVKSLTRLLLSRACDCRLDVQGRILMPASLRAAAGLQREAVVIGALNRFEIWGPAAWEQFLRDSERMLDDLTLDVPWPLPASPGPASPAPAPPASGTPRPQAKPKR